MEQQPAKGLTVIQWLLLVALLGIVLTIVATMWSGPDSAGADDAKQGIAETQ